MPFNVSPPLATILLAPANSTAAPTIYLPTVCRARALLWRHLIYADLSIWERISSFTPSPNILAATTIGGVIVDSGKFDWVANKKRFPMLNEPDPSYHDVVYTDALGAAAYIGRCRVVPLRNTGSALAPHSAFLIMQGLETLGLRIERHCENALAVANFLRQHPKVNWVNYAALSDSPYYANCQKITGGKASGILSFGIKGGKKAGAQFIDALQMILRLVNIGDAKSLACHPATTTHRQLSTEELKTAGVSEDLVRLSVGIEHIDDIIADIAQALEKVTI
jgi:O-acetylhomoserine sulfhydrylase